jgi:hypothetical protein
MPTHKLTPEIITAAIVGFEQNTISKPEESEGNECVLLEKPSRKAKDPKKCKVFWLTV